MPPHAYTRMILPGGCPSRSLKGEVDTVLDMLKEDLEFWELDPDHFRESPHDIREALIKRKRELGEKRL